jgi:RNA polymerase sigma factor (TIGR02999 family)
VKQITQVLNGISGDPKAASQLLPLVYEELRRLAAHRMANEAPGQTLQPTALVHEAWLRLTKDEDVKWEGRAHFFGAAAEAMRRILIENARRKRALRHGGGQQRVDALDLEMPEAGREDILLALDEALDKLAEHDRPKAELVKLRYFAGLSFEEASELLKVSVPTAKRWWAYARAWLCDEMHAQEADRSQVKDG